MTQKHQPCAKDFTHPLHPKQRRLEIHWSESFYCLQYCTQIHVFETQVFLSVHWVCVGWEQVWLLQLKMQGRSLVMLTETSCHEPCTDAQRELAGPARTTLSRSQAKKGLFVQTCLGCVSSQGTRTPTTWCRSHRYKYSQNQEKKRNIFFIKIILFLLHFMPKNTVHTFSSAPQRHRLIRPPANFVCEPCSSRKMAQCPGANQGVLLLTAAPCHSQLEKGSCSHITVMLGSLSSIHMLRAQNTGCWKKHCCHNDFSAKCPIKSRKCSPLKSIILFTELWQQSAIFSLICNS